MSRNGGLSSCCSATTWTEVAAHLDRALELDPQARAAWLAELRNSQPAVPEASAAQQQNRRPE